MLTENNMIELAARVTPQWVAGFVDGEGSISARYSEDTESFSVRLQVTQKNPIVLALLLVRFPGGITNSQVNKLKYGTFTKSHFITWNGRSAKGILETIKDHVIVKKSLVELALEFLEHITYAGGRTTDMEKSERSRICTEIKKINAPNEAQYASLEVLQ